MKRGPQLLVWTCLIAAAGFLAAQEAPRKQKGTAKDDHAHDHAQQSAKVERAIAVLQATEESGVKGTIHFIQRGDIVEVTGKIMGLEPGKHGFHVHEFGDLTDMKMGKSAGDHYNPTGEPHGKPDSHERHVGDLGNIEADENGVAEIRIRDKLLKLNGAHSILGRAIVVHAKADEFTQPSGDAGDRVALGVIGIAKSDTVREARKAE
jgi:superoxide dismutase, Cu-Zn family